MDDRVGTNPELRAQILEAYEEMGCPPEEAARITDAALLVHNTIETSRVEIITAGSKAFESAGLATNYNSFLLLIVQLELAHLNVVYQSLRAQVDGSTETVQ